MKTFIYILFFLFALGLSSGAVGQVSPPYQACFNANTVAFKTRGCPPLQVKMNNCSGGTNVPGHPFPHYIYGDGSAETTDSTHTYTVPGKYTVIQIVITNDPAPGAPTRDSLIRVDYIEVLDTPTPDFKIMNCINREVKVQTLNTDYDKYVIDWNDGSLQDSITGNSLISHFYATSTTKNITVTGIYLPAVAGCNSATITTPVTPVQNLVKPDLINLIVNRQNVNGQITLTLNAVKDQKYYLDQRIGTGPYTTIDSIAALASASVVSLPVNNLNTKANQYCYRFRSLDDCGNTVLSEEICSTIINATAQNNRNEITFNNIGPSVGSYTLYKNGAPIPAAVSPYIDSPVTCGVQYCYLVVTNLTTLTGLGSPMQSISDDSCVTAISTDVPPAVQNLASSVSGNSIGLTWDVPVFTPQPTQYTIRRSDGKITTSNTNSFTDNGVNVNTNQYCYLVYYTPCTVTSLPSYTTCPVLLNGIETGGVVNLSWDPYNICASGTPDYTVDRLDPNTNAVISSVPVGTSTTFPDSPADPDAASLKYRITTTCPTGAPSYSNIFEINHKIKIFLPDAFTPDGDGNNDVFIAKGNYVKDFKMTIFNRWGEVVFFSDQFTKGWDGMYKGEIASMDAYAYMVEATDKFGNKLTRKGTVTLLR